MASQRAQKIAVLVQEERERGLNKTEAYKRVALSQGLKAKVVEMCFYRVEKENPEVLAFDLNQIPPIEDVIFTDFKKISLTEKDRPRLAICIGDHHVPYISPFTVGVQLLWCKEFQPDEIIFGGDFFDFYAVSNFDKNPARLKRDRLTDELNVGYSILKAFRDACPKANITYIEGNHEARLFKYKIRNTPEVDGVKIAGTELEPFTVKSLARLDELNIRYIESVKDESEVEIGGVWFGHWRNANRYSGYTIKNLLDRFMVPCIQNHVHRAGVHFRKVKTGMIQGRENPCSCLLTPEYLLNTDWQNGFTTIAWIEDNIIMETCIVDNGIAKWGDWIVEPRDI